MLKKVSDIIFTSFKYFCVVHCITEHVGDVFLCSGDSMEPTIHSGDIVIIKRFSKVFNSINKGDIVIAKSPVEHERFIMKRVKAIDGQMVKKGMTVPKGSVWLQGDNHTNSTDSRDFGPVPKGLIQGRVLCRVWPLSNLSMNI